MSDGSIAEPDVIDWEELILEAQTDPCGVTSSDAFGQIYDELHDYVWVMAKNWLSTHQLSEAHDGTFAAVAWDLIAKLLPTKFKIPDRDPNGICNAFKAWVGTCCKHEWERRKIELADTTVDPVAVNHLQITTPTEISSLEDTLCSTEPVSSKMTDGQLKRKILEEELGKYIESMRDAILETIDLKDISNMNSKGKHGEAAAIAEKYGHKPNAVRTRLFRLREKVKERYEKERSK